MDDFHEFRSQGIGGSDAPIIEGLSPWTTPYELWEEKALGKVKDHDNYATRHGKALEGPTRERFEKLMGTFFVPDRVISASRPWIRANLDGVNFEKTDIVEIKNPLGPKDHELAKEGDISPKYYSQCQHIWTAAAEAGWPLQNVWYFSHYKGDYVCIPIRQDHRYIIDLARKENLFWQKVIHKKWSD